MANGNTATKAKSVAKDADVQVVSGADQGDDEQICMCMNLTRGDLLQKMAEGVDFEGLLEVTGAGKKCTACLLDIEYFFETAPRRKTAGAKPAVNSAEDVALRRRLYSWIDKRAPLVPMRIADIAPVLYGPGIRQEFCVSNDTMHFHENLEMTPVTAKLVLRDEDGKLLSRKSLRIADREIAWERCEELEQLGKDVPEGSFKVGSLAIERVWDKPSKRGATRPHFLIHTRGGVSNLHTQDSGGSGDQLFSLPYRQDEERVFVTLVNDTDAAVNTDLTYPVGRGVTPIVKTKVAIPARGARVHEIDRDALAEAGFEGTMVLVRLGKGPNRKVHMIFATPDLSVLSIDHVSG